MISILIPIYNGIEFIDESVTSVLNQVYTEWEIIIGINGHPADSSVYRIAKNYECDKIKVYDMPEITHGKSEALNEMLKYTKYNWICLLDVDDKWLPCKLQNQIQYMEKYDVVGTKCKYFGDLNNVPQIPIGDLKNYDFKLCNPIINSSCLLKKELCHWNWNGVEDYDLWLTLKKQGYNFYNVDSIEVLHRIHKSSAFNAKGNNLLVKKLLNSYNSLW